MSLFSKLSRKASRLLGGKSSSKPRAASVGGNTAQSAVSDTFGRQRLGATGFHRYNFTKEPTNV